MNTKHGTLVPDHPSTTLEPESLRTKSSDTAGNARPRVVLIAPAGEGVGGIIAQTNLLVQELRRQDLVELKVIDSAQRYRDYHDLSFFSRAWGGSWQAGRIAMTLLVLFVRFKPDAVVVRSSASMGLVRDFVLCALARLLGAPADVSFHFGRIPELAVQRNWEWRLLGMVVRTAHTVSVLDHSSLAVLVDSFPNSRITQVPNAVDLDRIDEIRERVNPGGSKRTVPLFVFAGMVLPSKGVVELVDACSRIEANFELEMVGPVGPEMREQLCAIAARREAGRWLRFTGAVSNDEAVERIAAADVFVLPSYTEGFPVSVLEAMAVGTAVVATRVGAIPEMLQGNNGEAAGIVVPPRDIESLKLAIEDLLQNPAKRSRLGAAARRKCEASYQLSDHARRMVSNIWSKPDTGRI